VSDLGAFLGRFHPLVVHLPIGILIAAGLLEALARTQRFAGVRPAVGPTLIVGAAGAVLSAASGWLLGESGGYGGDTYTWHLRMGVGVAVGAVLTAAAYLAGSTTGQGPRAQGLKGPRDQGFKGPRARGLEGSRAEGCEGSTVPAAASASSPLGPWALGPLRPTARRVYPVLLVLTLVHVAAAGHLGGTLTHGEGYLTEYAPAFLRAGAGAEPAVTRVASETVVFDTLVQPVLDARCVSCHGPDSAQGGLRLDSVEALARGGDSGPVLAAGHPERSELLRRIWLPPSHREAMPPRGRRPVTASESALLAWWVSEGASFDGTLADANVTPVVQPVIEAALGPLDLGAPAILAVQVPPANPAAIETVMRTGVGVTPLADGTPFLRVHATTVAGTFGDAQVDDLLPLAPQVTWLSLSGTGVTDEGLARLAQFSHLTRLHLDRTGVGDAGLAHLARLERLEYLNLYGTSVTDEGLQQLAGLQQLRTVYLWQTKVTPDGAERLTAALPRLRVDLGAPEPVRAARQAPGTRAEAGR
jgi:hypothetical protein